MATFCARILDLTVRASTTYWNVGSIVCGTGGGIFIPNFRNKEGGVRMTMPKREVNNIWSRVRADVDVDDLIFEYDRYHSYEDGDSCSDR